ncbi:oligosaccharide flippase family protein [Richelia sinica FACHB-800]|nr:oligosaccharide flippase family protein [Richelia sinica FACHB-800]
MKKALANNLLFRKILKNTSWLLGGRVMTGLSSLLYLSLATHNLGDIGFGKLVLILTYVQIITDLTTFQSSQAVIRYGAICLHKNNNFALQQLLKFTTILDFLGVIVGLIIAVIAAPHMSFYLGWDQATVIQVQWYSLIMLFTSTATARGLLQLCDRFDLLALQITIPTLIRMFGAIVASILNASWWVYLWLCFISEALGGLLLFFAGWQVAVNRGMLQNMNWSVKNLSQEHPGLLKFSIVSNFDSSLPMIMRQASPLVVGIFATPAAVGLFQVSYELATPLKYLAQIFTQSVYPELARLDSQKKFKLFIVVLVKSTLFAIVIGLVIFLLSVFLGKMILKYAFGEGFISAHQILVLLVIAEVFTMGNCALEPAFYALGKPSVPLKVNAIAILGFYLPLLLILTSSFGVIGAGIATLSSTALILILNSLLIWPQLRHR